MYAKIQHMLLMWLILQIGLITLLKDIK